MRPTHLLERAQDQRPTDADRPQEAAGLVLSRREAEQEVLGRDVAVAEIPGLPFGPLERPLEVPGKSRLTAPLDAREGGEGLRHAIPNECEADPGLLEHQPHDPLPLLEERREEVGARDLGMARCPREAGGGLKCLSGPDGEAIGVGHG